MTDAQILDFDTLWNYGDPTDTERQFRQLWNQRINAAARMFGTTYSRLMGGLIKAGIEIDRKNLADLAIQDLKAFESLCVHAMK